MNKKETNGNDFEHKSNLCGYTCSISLHSSNEGVRCHSEYTSTYELDGNFVDKYGYFDDGGVFPFYPLSTHKDVCVDYDSIDNIPELKVASNDIGSIGCEKQEIQGYASEDDLQVYSKSLYNEDVEEDQITLCQGVLEDNFNKFSNPLYGEKELHSYKENLISAYQDNLYDVEMRPYAFDNDHVVELKHNVNNDDNDH